MEQQTYQPNLKMPDLNAFFNPRRCEVCGRALNPAGTEWLNQWNETFYMPLMKGLNQMWGGMLDPWMQGMKSVTGQQTEHSHAKHGHDCCSCCEPHDCHCRCCIANADVAVYARLGEQRVVSLVVENHLRREREIELQLSDWTTHGGQPAKIEGHILGPDKFTLKPCEERVVVITIRVANEQMAAGMQTMTAGESSPATEQESPSDTAFNLRQVGEAERLPDVDDCRVFYADLRVKGCDIRPIRIALAVMPRDCAAYRVECSCGCCC